MKDLHPKLLVKTTCWAKRSALSHKTEQMIPQAKITALKSRGERWTRTSIRETYTYHKMGFSHLKDAHICTILLIKRETRKKKKNETMHTQACVYKCPHGLTGKANTLKSAQGEQPCAQLKLREFIWKMSNIYERGGLCWGGRWGK